MISQSFAFLALTATCLTLSIPPEPSRARIPTQSQTLPSLLSPPNATNTRLNGWPDAPFSKHLGWDTDIEILSRSPSPPTDPTSEMGVLEGISIIGAKARSQSRTATIEDFRADSGPVSFDFHATEELFRGPDVAVVLDALWDMTNLYGKGEVYGCLVRVGVHIAFFELGLKRVAVAK